MKEIRFTNVEYEDVYDFDAINGKGGKRLRINQPDINGKYNPHPPPGPIPRCTDNRRRLPEIRNGLYGRRHNGKPKLGPAIHYDHDMNVAPAGPRPKFVNDRARLPPVDNGGHRHNACANRHTQAPVQATESNNARRLPAINPGQNKLGIDAIYEELMTGHDKADLENNPWVVAYEKRNGLGKRYF